jgi:hypothetical protein
MRLLVINAVGDPSTERTRRRFPGKVFQRPVIGTLPLAPAGRRVLPVEMLKPDLIDQLEYLVSIGNIKVLELGARSAVDFDELRRRMGYLTRTVTEPPTPEASGPSVPLEIPAESGVPSVEVCSFCGGSFPAPVGLHHTEAECVQAQLPPATTPGEVPDPPQAPTETLDQALTRIDDVRTADIEEMLAGIEDAPPAPSPEPAPGPGETFTLPGDIDDLIRSAKNKKLVAVLAIFEKSGVGKNKLVLVSEVSAVLSGDPDPVLANRAIALLRQED